MKKRLVLVLAVLLAVPLIGISHATALTSKAMFDWHAGDSFGGFLESPDVASASNGDTITIIASGTLDAAARTATGSGTFTHTTAGGALVGSGTFTANGLLSFQFYGCDGDGIPGTFCGGRALITVHLIGTTAGGAIVEADGILAVNCLVGSPPAGFSEGITLNVTDLINFNKSVSGETLFVKTS